MDVCEYKLIVKSPTLNIGQKCVDRFEETGIEIYFSKTTSIRFVRFRAKNVFEVEDGAVKCKG